MESPVNNDKNFKTDEEIARAVQKGASEEFGVLVDRYEAKLTRYAHKFLANREDVKDLVQEVFIKTYKNIKSFNPSRRFSPWIYRIAHNEFVNALGRKQRDKMLFNFDAFFPHPAAKETSDAQALENDLRQTIDFYLNRLDAKYREPLILYYFQDLNYKEIADILHIPVATVGVRLQRAKSILKKLMGSNNNYGK